MKNPTSRRRDIIVFASSVLLGATGFAAGTTYACEKRGREVSEQWLLEVVESDIQGTPRGAGFLDVGDDDHLYRKGKDGNLLVLELMGLRFEEV